MAIATADKDAFEAYNILYYPLFGERGVLNLSPAAAKATPGKEDLAWALTAAENLKGTPYRLTRRSQAVLAKYHAAMNAMFSVSSNSSAASGMLVDPAADVRSFLPEAGEPLYPDFPSQVIEMDEHDFRADQVRHYLSMYGAEISGNGRQEKGWRLDADRGTRSEGEKPEQLDGGVPAMMVDVTFSPDDVEALLDSEFSRPARMSVPALRLAARQMSGYGYEPAGIAFHENMMGLIAVTSSCPSAEAAKIMGRLCQHPGDLLKSVTWSVENREDGKRRLPTKMKKAYCEAFETFDAVSIAQNIVDAGKAARKAPNYLSAARFAGPSLSKALSAVEKGEVRSWNSRLEGLWDEYRAAPSVETCRELLSFYGQRPGVLLRSIGRLAEAGVPDDELTRSLISHSEDFSLATLVSIQTVMSALDAAESIDFDGRVSSRWRDRSFFDKQTVHAKIARLTLPILIDRLSQLDTPLKGKKVSIDDCGFSLPGSIVLPNAVGFTSGAYPPAGMAYKIPEEGIVRFFTFWDDRSKRVDVDLHFNAEKADGSFVHVGWNGDFSEGGMTTSGDITSSIDAAEYLDVDMKAADGAGVATIVQHQHIYSGADDWRDIDTCFSGALLVDPHDKKAGSEIYSSKNVLFHDDMTGCGDRMDYAMVDVPGHYVRILRGTDLPFRHNGFTLDLYLNLLLRAQGCQVVSEGEDVVLAVGRSEENKAISLIDNKFFIM